MAVNKSKEIIIGEQLIRMSEMWQTEMSTMLVREYKNGLSLYSSEDIIKTIDYLIDNHTGFKMPTLADIKKYTRTLSSAVKRVQIEDQPVVNRSPVAEAYMDYHCHRFNYKRESSRINKKQFSKMFDISDDPWEDDITELKRMKAWLSEHKNKDKLNLSHIDDMIWELEGLKV